MSYETLLGEEILRYAEPYSNFDIIFDRLLRIHQLCATLYPPCGVFY